MAEGLFSTTGYITIVYIIAIFGIGIWGARKTKTYRDFWNTSGRLGLVVLAGTVLATGWGGISLLGIAGFAYQHFWMGAWYSLGTIIRFVFWAIIMAIVLRKVNAFSISEWYGLRFDDKNAVLLTILNLIVSLGVLGAQFLGFASVITVFFNVPFQTSVVIGAVVVTVYTVIGGLWGVAYTDTIQIIISGGAAVGLVLYLTFTRGGYQMIRASENVPSGYFDAMNVSTLGDLNFGLLFFLTLIFLWLADMFLNLNMQRMVSAKNLKTAYWAPIFGALSYVLVAYITPTLGAYGRVILGTGLDRPDLAFPMLAEQLLPPYVAGLVAAALLAVVMSTGDSNLLGASTLAANDLYRAYRPEASEKQVLRMARVITLLYAAIALFSSLYFDTIIGLILAFLTIGWAVVPSLWASFAWRRATPNAVFWSMVIGGGVNLLLMVAQNFSLVPAVAEMNPGPSYYTGWIGFAIAVVILFAGSYIEGRESVPDNVKSTQGTEAVADGGVDREAESLEERAEGSIKQIHF